jgi:uncharacterized iron-regulated protein
MHRFAWLACVVLAACHRGTGAAALSAFALPDSTSLVDGATGAPVATAELLRRAGTADFVLLGEVHDNPTAHAVRGGLLHAFAGRRPAVVFEQFAASDTPIAKPAPGDSLSAWLDRNGFDRRGWRWPLHEPVVSAAIADGRSLWGSNLPRESLRAVVTGGAAAAPEPLRQLMAQAPLDSAARAALDRDIIEGHCNRLPASMVPGMRAAQEARDAAMTRALLLASADGPAWLIAGNGHVRADIAVPRILHRVAPERTLLVVGLLERREDGAAPPAEERQRYDVAILIPHTARPDPCANVPVR